MQILKKLCLWVFNCPGWFEQFCSIEGFIQVFMGKTSTKLEFLHIVGFALKSWLFLKVRKLSLLPSSYTFWGQNTLNRCPCCLYLIQIFVWFVPDCAMTNDWQKKWSDSKVSSDSSNCAKTYRIASKFVFTQFDESDEIFKWDYFFCLIASQWSTLVLKGHFWILISLFKSKISWS